MDKIAQANIDKFKLLLETETDLTKRAMILRLLLEQEDEKRRLMTKAEAKQA